MKKAVEVSNACTKDLFKHSFIYLSHIRSLHCRSLREINESAQSPRFFVPILTICWIWRKVFLYALFSHFTLTVFLRSNTCNLRDPKQICVSTFRRLRFFLDDSFLCPKTSHPFVQHWSFIFFEILYLQRWTDKHSYCLQDKTAVKTHVIIFLFGRTVSSSMRLFRIQTTNRDLYEDAMWNTFNFLALFNGLSLDSDALITVRTEDYVRAAEWDIVLLNGFVLGIAFGLFLYCVLLSLCSYLYYPSWCFLQRLLWPVCISSH